MKKMIIFVLSLFSLYVGFGLYSTQAASSDDTPPVSIKGKAFIRSGERFMVRGIALSGVDEKANDDLLSDDNYNYMKSSILPKLVGDNKEALHVNTIRVYRVDPSKKHDNTMNLLKESGVYVILEIMNQDVNVNRIDPKYTYALIERVKKVIDAFAKYDNVLGFSVGNEVVFPGNILGTLKPQKREKEASAIETKDARVEKLLMRFAKQYIKQKGYRQIPVGVAMQDGPSYSMTPEEKNLGMIGTDVVAKYYACDTDGGSADFIGINSYRYITPKPNQPDNLNAYFNYINDVKDFSVPVIFTEMGGQQRENDIPIITRDWAIIPHEYQTPELANQFSGDVAFMFFDTSERLGLYDQKTLAPTTYGPGVTGGAETLSNVFASVSATTPAMPPDVSATACPKDFNPALDVGTEITVQNVGSDLAVVIEKDGDFITVLEPGSQKNPVGNKVKVKTDAELMFLQPGSWNMICSVTANKLKGGETVTNNVPWGSPCTIATQSK